MLIWLLRLMAALLLTYGVSRLLRRAPLPVREPGRSLLVHAISAAVVCTVDYSLRQATAPLLAPLLAQLGWCLLDIARARAGGSAVMARAR